MARDSVLPSMHGRQPERLRTPFGDASYAARSQFVGIALQKRELGAGRVGRAEGAGDGLEELQYRRVEIQLEVERYKATGRRNPARVTVKPGAADLNVEFREAKGGVDPRRCHHNAGTVS